MNNTTNGTTSSGRGSSSNSGRSRSGGGSRRWSRRRRSSTRGVGQQRAQEVLGAAECVSDQSQGEGHLRCCRGQKRELRENGCGGEGSGGGAGVAMRGVRRAAR